MAKFIVSVTSEVPTIYSAEVEVEAENEQAAKDLVVKMYNEDEIDWSSKEKDYDEAILRCEDIVEIKEE